MVAKTKAPPKPKQGDKITGFKCTSCDSVYATEAETEPQYECGNCGETFSRSNSADGGSHKCPSCNKFAAKTEARACPDCSEELEEAELKWNADDNEWQVVDEDEEDEGAEAESEDEEETDDD